MSNSIPNASTCPLCGTTHPAGAIHCPTCQTNLQQARFLQTLAERVSTIEQVLIQQGHSLPSPPVTSPSSAAPPTAITKTAPSTAPPPPDQPSTRPPEPAGRLPEEWLHSDFWLNKIGLGLLLLALAFLFNYAVDQGWLTPAVRLSIGLLLGTGLIGVGYRIHPKRPNFGQLLLGGGVAAYYITGFAAFQLYELVPYWPAFGFMGGVTLLAFVLSQRQKAASLSLVGGLGGLLTPLLLATESGSVIGLVLYSCLICGLLIAIYVVRGWQVVLWLAVGGGWLIMLWSVFAGEFPDDVIFSAEKIVVQAGLLFYLLGFWLVPVGRTLVQSAYSDRLPEPSLGLANSFISAKSQSILNRHIHSSILFNPLLCMVLTWALWGGVPWRQIYLFEGSTALTAVLLFGTIAWRLNRHEATDLAFFHGATAVLFLTFAIGFLLPEDVTILFWAIEGASLLYLTTRIPRISLKLVAYVFSLFVASGLLALLTESATGTAVFNRSTLLILGTMSAMFVGSLFVPTAASLIFRFFLHGVMLALLWREFSIPPAEQGFVTTSWGVYALLLLAIALLFQRKRLRLVAIGTLLLLVGKLFVIDLVTVEPIYRILLFAGFGALFLFISYNYRGWLGLSEARA